MNRRIALLLLIILPVIFSCTEKEPEVEQVIRVESVSVSQNSAALTIGETLQLTASVSPASATNKNISWSSSNQAIASVSASGLVTALGEGTTTITATADGKQGTCSVTVSKGVVNVSEIKLDKTELTLYEGDEETLTATVSPDDATDKTITWSSSDNTIATVESGKVKAEKKGEATITATAGGKIAEIKVVVLAPVSGLSLNKDVVELYIGESETLAATLEPADATPREEIIWSSSDTQVATVENGTLTALKEGTTTITASVEGFKAECIVTVNERYETVAITDLKPVDILPAIGQVTGGDKKVYDHIEHLRIAEAMRIRDIMWKYGAGNHSMEDYQQLMGRLVVGMSLECPSISKSFEVVGRGFSDLSTWGNGHSDAEWRILDLIVPNTRRILELNAFYDAEVGGFNTEKPDQIDWINMEAFLAANPNSIVIIGRSSDVLYLDGYYEAGDAANLRKFCRAGRLIFFKAGGNVRKWQGVFTNKTFHKDVEPDGIGQYSTHSMANGKNDTEADMALLVSVGTGSTGDIDQTGYIYESSAFPVGFHDKVLFAGRTLPLLEDNGSYRAYTGHYASSYANYYNAAIMSLCFQMYAEAKDVFELLDMVRSTCLTDYIRLDGQTQPLQLINPAGLYKKYLTPQNLPASISAGETINLDKGYYKGVLFSIPGAEVKVNGEWIAFDNKNKDVIMSQNPMNLEWRLDGERLQKYGYTSGQTIEGQIITVDDKWGGLRLEVPMTIKIQ